MFDDLAVWPTSSTLSVSPLSRCFPNRKEGGSLHHADGEHVDRLPELWAVSSGIARCISSGIMPCHVMPRVTCQCIGKWYKCLDTIIVKSLKDLEMMIVPHAGTGRYVHSRCEQRHHGTFGRTTWRLLQWKVLQRKVDVKHVTAHN